MTEEQFKILIGRTRGRLLRYAVAILHSLSDAEDAVSDVVERLYRGRDKISADQNAEAFMMTAVRNACYDAVRRRRPQVEISETIIPSVPPDASDTIELMRYAMTKVKEREREVIHLKDIEGYSTDEIAAIFETSETNVRMILSRGRRDLREVIIKLMQI